MGKAKRKAAPVTQDAVERGMDLVDEGTSHLCSMSSPTMNDIGSTIEDLVAIAARTPAGKRALARLGRRYGGDGLTSRARHHWE